MSSQFDNGTSQNGRPDVSSSVHDERVVHEHVEPPVLGGDAIEERGDRVVVAVVARDRDAGAAERVDLVRGRADRARERVVGLAHRPAGHVDGRAGRAELERAALADARGSRR